MRISAWIAILSDARRLLQRNENLNNETSQDLYQTKIAISLHKLQTLSQKTIRIILANKTLNSVHSRYAQTKIST